MAKDILANYINILVDDSGSVARNLSTDLIPGTLDGVGEEGDSISMAGQNQNEYYLIGRKDGDLTCQFFMNDTATTGAHTVLKGILGLVRTVTVQFGTGAAPTTGDPEWEGEYILQSLRAVIVDGKMAYACVFKRGDATGPAWTTISA